MHDNSESARNIVLTGFMGTGKSTVARLVAERLGREFVDSDDVIEAEFGPIERIFATGGEAGFRARERQVAEQLAGSRGIVIATGGGMLLDQGTVDLFKESSTIFCLRADPDEILRRVLGDAHADRPLLADSDPRDRIRQLLTERENSYARFTQITTDNKSPEEVANEILEILLLTD